jgi:hypothetical protein
MKKFYFLLAAFIAIQFNAQQAGKAGELLKNEVSKSEINTQKNDSFNRNNPNNNNDSFRGNSNIGSNLKYPKEEILITNGITITILDMPKFL